MRSKVLKTIPYGFYITGVVGSLQPENGTLGGSPYTTGETGAPLFTEAFALLECRVVGKMEAGDHTVYLGEVAAANLERPADILTDLDTTMDYGG
jgi:flavin reductase (DIM6/NTAB) family NADH-FMN oxidoreductase RutF